MKKKDTFRPTRLTAESIGNTNLWLMVQYFTDEKEIPYVELSPSKMQINRFDNQYHFATQEQIERDFRAWYEHGDITRWQFILILNGIEILNSTV